VVCKNGLKPPSSRFFSPFLPQPLYFPQKYDGDPNLQWLRHGGLRVAVKPKSKAFTTHSQAVLRFETVFQRRVQKWLRDFIREVGGVESWLIWPVGGWVRAGRQRVSAKAPDQMEHRNCTSCFTRFRRRDAAFRQLGGIPRCWIATLPQSRRLRRR
jgi:hypothetical protein